MKKDKKKYLLGTLFKELFLISALTVGGGYVIVPLVQKKFVKELKWVEDEEMIDIVAMSQASPGIFTINTAIMLGYRLDGMIGAVVAVIAAVLPPLISVTLISLFYATFRNNTVLRNGLKGAQAVVGAIMINVVIEFAGKIFKNKYWVTICLMVLAFVGDFILGINTVVTIISCAIIGTIVQMVLSSLKRGPSQ